MGTGQQQRHRVVGNFIEAIVGNASYDDSLPGCGGDVDVVHANAEASDDPAAIELRDHIRGQLGVGGEDGVGVFRDLKNSFRLGFGGEAQIRVDLRQHLARRIQIRENGVRNRN
jgi:hypothetical protein